MKIDIDLNPEYKDITVTIKAPEMKTEVTELMNRLQSPKSKSIIGKIDQKLFILNPHDIVIFYSNEQKVLAETMDKAYEVKQKLYELEEELGGESFVRISKYAIVNIDKIKDIEMFFNGSLVVNLVNNKQEYISRRYVSKVKQYIGMGGK